MADGSAEEPFRSLVKRLAEALSVLTAGAFLLSAIINSAIFLGWGVTFLAIATPTDVVMSGLQLLVYALALVAIVGLLAGALLADEPSQRWRRRGKIWIITGAAWASLIPVAIIAWRLRAGSPMGLPLAEQFQIIAAGVLGFCILHLVASIGRLDPAPGLLDAVRGHWTGVRPIPALADTGPILYAALLAMSVGGLLASTVAAVGFVPQGTWYDGPGDAGCAPMRVLWIGQASLLVQCPADGQVRVLNRAGDRVVLRISARRPAAVAGLPAPSGNGASPPGR